MSLPLDVYLIICDELDKVSLARLSRTCRTIRQATVRPIVPALECIEEPSLLRPFVKPSYTLPHPCLENVTRLKITSRYDPDAPDLYPALSFPNLAHLRVNIESLSYRESHDYFGSLANLIPRLDPTHLHLPLIIYQALAEYHCPSLASSTQTWTRLEVIAFNTSFVSARGGEGVVSKVMGDLFYENVTHLEGAPMLEVVKLKVVFDWRDFYNQSALRRAIGPPTWDCSLLRLPSWMRFEIVVGLEVDCLKKDAVDRWLDEYCVDDEMRARMTVIQSLSIANWVDDE